MKQRIDVDIETIAVTAQHGVDQLKRDGIANQDNELVQDSNDLQEMLYPLYKALYLKDFDECMLILASIFRAGFTELLVGGYVVELLEGIVENFEIVITYKDTEIGVIDEADVIW